MDTNYLLKREQVSLMMARDAACACSRRAHAGLARGYGDRLAAGPSPHRRFDLVVVNDPGPSEPPTADVPTHE
ncbi:MAG TPA: hypothetical protein VH326_09350 [Sphingomonas sp.]|jgi:hypothetical protein|nr:hypothetical protein [Sphingomonas sp.]